MLRMSLVLIVSVASTAVSSASANPPIGQTWPIIEPDALTEIEGKASHLAPIAKSIGSRAHWSAMTGATLGIAQTDRVRTVVPFYTLDHELRLPDGRLLYPKGFTFNPLSYVRLSQRLIIVAPHDLDWALSQAKPTDWILLTGGDPIALGDKAGRTLFLLEPQVKARLGLTVAPVIVRQIGQRFELSEVHASAPALSGSRS